jgi:uncharacterized short protein YbdD (DUF466 family)
MVEMLDKGVQTVNNLVWLHPDHPNYISWMMQNHTDSIISTSQFLKNYF